MVIQSGLHAIIAANGKFDERMRLTKDEIKLVAFLLSALLLGVTVKHYRHKSRPELPAPPAHVTQTPKGEVDYE